MAEDVKKDENEETPEVEAHTSGEVLALQGIPLSKIPADSLMSQSCSSCGISVC
ncbi:MAG TPA: hypothetical protein VL551_33850 [Actinospica sp.]|nr:hypothetical protein [Actinospica sp.]